MIFSLIIPCVDGQSFAEKVQFQLDSILSVHPEARGMIIHIEAPEHSISHTAFGQTSQLQSNPKLKGDQPVLIASNTKTYVAATILKLVENGKLRLDQPIKDRIRSKTRKLFLKDGYALDQITIRHLLSHSSGIDDYVNDDYFAYIDSNQNKRWTRNEQIKLAIKVGDPLDVPGKQFKYADINFLLLTEIIEKASGKKFYKAMRDLIDFESLGLKTTWFETLEKRPEGVDFLVNQYWSKYNWNSNLIDPSWDLYGGGGLAATAKDVSLFYQYLFTGKIIQNKELLKELYSYVLPQEVSGYCLGLSVIDFDGYIAYYHGGFWGTDTIYLPELNATITAFVLEKNKRILNAQLSKLIISLINEETP